jgi:Ca2+-binding EF-hand superfamily protein
MVGRFFALIGAIGIAVALAGAPALAKSGEKALKLLDTDNDKTVDLAEAKKAATAVFDKFNKDNDKTIDTKELGGRLSKKDLEAADPDKDGTLTIDEYLALVEARFKAADPDNDGKLDAKELSSPAGKDLVKLLK